MKWEQRWSVRLTVAAVVLTGASGILTVTAFRLAAGESSLAPGAQPSPPQLPSAVSRTRVATAESLLVRTIENNPFRPERAPAEVAFLLPSEETDSQQPRSAPSGPIVLVGTVVLADDRSFIMCRVGAETPRVVRVGDKVGDYTLRRVAQGTAAFETAHGKLIEISVPKAGT
jgi:hypothetical protein